MQSLTEWLPWITRLSHGLYADIISDNSGSNIGGCLGSNHRELEQMEGKVKSGISGVGPTLQPHSSTLDVNFWIYHHISKKLRSRPFFWGVKHFCRNTRSWFFSCLNIGVFRQIANFPILLKISESQDQVNIWLFFFRRLKNQLLVFLQKCLTPQKKHLNLNF